MVPVTLEVSAGEMCSFPADRTAPVGILVVAQVAVPEFVITLVIEEIERILVTRLEVQRSGKIIEKGITVADQGILHPVQDPVRIGGASTDQVRGVILVNGTFHMWHEPKPDLSLHVR